MAELKSYAVWDAPTRWFHWINALCVIGLAALGLMILNDGGLGISNAGKVALKTVHTWVGYVLALNLLWRFVWAFLGNRFARWREILPGGPGYIHALRTYVASFLAGHPEQYLGHNPLARVSVAALFLLRACGPGGAACGGGRCDRDQGRRQHRLRDVHGTQDHLGQTGRRSAAWSRMRGAYRLATWHPSIREAQIR